MARKKKQVSDDDDSSVDSKGNIRNLIDYDYDENDNDDDYSDSDSESDYVLVKKYIKKPQKKQPSPRKKIHQPEHSAGVKSKKNIQSRSKIELKEKNKKILRKHMKRNLIVESSDDEDTSDKRKSRKTDESEPKKKSHKPRLVKLSDKMSEDDSDSDEDSVSSSEYKSKLRKSTRKSKPISEEEDEESSNKESEGSELDDSDQDDSESEEEATDDDDDDDDDSDYEDDVKSATQRIGLMISNFGAPKDNNQPKKFKMKEQPPIVKKFVKLVQQETSNEDQSNNIDTDISYFKQLSDSKQNMIIDKMERKFSVDETTVPIKFKILEKQVPAQVEKLALSKYNALMNMDTSSTEYYKGFHWIEGYSNMPLGVYKDLPVKLEDGQEACSAFVTKVRQNMDEAIYGHDEAKLQILQFVSSWIANPKGIGNVVSIHGPMGVGKTTLVKNGIAKALDRPFHFISLGGASDASFLDGHSYTYEGSTWGRIADILIQSKCMNPIIYFDELDKISETPKGEEIMNLLIHITDGSQNDRFQDKYFTGIDLDLSRCLFIFSHNNHERVSPILRDRMYNIRVSGFNLKEKQVIAEQYLIEQTLKEIGLFEKLSISQDVVQHIVEEYTGDEKGVRELKRCIHTVMSKLNLLRFYNDPKKVPFAIADFSLPFILKKEHLKLLLKKPAEEDQSWKSLYN